VKSDFAASENMAALLLIAQRPCVQEARFYANLEASPATTANSRVPSRFFNKADSLLAQQNQRIKRKRALRRNPGGQQPQQRHRQDETSGYQRVARSCLIHDGSEHSARQNSQEQS
jgi:hypothetical protein